MPASAYVGLNLDDEGYRPFAEFI